MAKDKWQHLGLGLIIALILGIWSPVFGFLMAVFLGAMKEIFDSMTDGIVDLWDFVATMAGAMIGAILIALIL